MSQRRNRRAGVEDRWRKTIRDAAGNTNTVPSANDGKGKRWRARYVDEQGVERSAGNYHRKVDAQRAVDAVTAAMSTGTNVAPRAGSITVASHYERWITSQGHYSSQSEATRRSSWNVHVGPHWGARHLSDVETSAVRSWVAQMVSDGTGPTTIENAYGLLRLLMSAAVEERRVGRNPCQGVKLPPRPHADRGYLTHKQVHALANAVTWAPEIVLFLAYTGLRWGEAAALRVQDFDMLRRRVNVSRSFDEKAGKIKADVKDHERRSVPFPAALAERIAPLMENKGRDDLVFTTLDGTVLRVSNYRPRYFAKAVAKCQEADENFPTITPHDLRHTAASLAVSAGANVKGVQRMLGHAKASMTLDVYSDLFDDDLDAVAGALDTAMAAALAPADKLRTDTREGASD